MSVKDLDKFVRHFVLKSVQVIVQSRLGAQTVGTQCNARGNDWFNLAIHDIKDINEQTKKCWQSLSSDDYQSESNDCVTPSMSIQNDWRVCCEISMKTNEGNSMILEHWFVTNETIDETNDTQWSSSGPPLIIYNIYNRMSLMLKSLVSLTRATPAFKLARGQSAHSYVICYRVYRCDAERDTVASEDDASFFSSTIQLGSIKSAYNELYISFTYRTDLTFGCNTAVNDMSTTSISKSPQLMPLKNDHFKREERLKRVDDRDPTKPLMAAFAASNINTESLPLLPDAPFSQLLLIEDDIDCCKKTTELVESTPKNKEIVKSSPIVIPNKNNKPDNSFASSPVYSSSGDSFVFVELKPPFAPEEHHELGSFFNGPSPTFTGSCGESTSDLSELTVQLAELESNAQQWDSFVESICLNDSEDLKTDV